MHITDTCKDYLHLQKEFLKKNDNFERNSSVNKSMPQVP